MPHITVDGCNTNRQIQQINIHTEIVFARETFVTPKTNMKMQELKDKLEAVVAEYFDGADISSDIHSNHDWNTRMNNH